MSQAFYYAQHEEPVGFLGRDSLPATRTASNKKTGVWSRQLHRNLRSRGCSMAQGARELGRGS